MSDYSIAAECIQLGGTVSSCVDMRTGETLLDRRQPGDGWRMDRQGLSNPHICTQDQPDGRIEYYLGGTLMHCVKPHGSPAPHDRGIRSTISEFSVASRRRLMYKLGKIQRAELPIFITLTYPAEFPSASASKNDLRRWWQRLERKFSHAGCVWKLEPQKRGAPHFHLMIWGVGHVPLTALMAWVSRSWYEVVGSNDPKHLIAGTRVETVRSGRGVRSYASKYLGKVIDTDDWSEPGRFWGVKGADNIPWADLVTVSVSFGDAAKVLRLMRRYIHCKRSNLPGLTILCENPDWWFDHFPDMAA